MKIAGLGTLVLFTAASPRVSDSKIARRLGSASAWKIRFSATAVLAMEDI